MEVTKYMLSSYPKVQPYEGINVVEDRLLNKGYLVVLENNDFVGVLTPGDLIKRPRKIVVDCLTSKENVFHTDTLACIFKKFNTSQSPALPVFREDTFLGIIDKENLLKNFKVEFQHLYKQSKISSKMKGSFLQLLSHEIRTPLNSVLGFMDIISNLDQTQFNNETYIDAIYGNAGRFLRTMDNLIDFAHINSGEVVVLEKDEINIEKIFLEVKKHIETAILASENREVYIQYEINAKSPIIISDEKKIGYALYNIITVLIYLISCSRIHMKYEIDETNILFFITGFDPQISDPQKEEILSCINSENNISTEIIELSFIQDTIKILGGELNLSIDSDVVFSCVVPLKHNETSEVVS